MLVLSRKVGQRVLIGDSISITVVRAAPGVVRIGIEAPPEFVVIREELKEDGEAVVDNVVVDNVATSARPRARPR